jgi:hypothetical protein
MLVELAVVALLLLIGNIAFWHFDPDLPLWRRALKVVIALAVTAAVSYYFGRTGVIVAGALVLVPLIYVHGIWLPRHGVNGWSGEPRERYHELRGWPPPRN